MRREILVTQPSELDTMTYARDLDQIVSYQTPQPQREDFYYFSNDKKKIQAHQTDKNLTFYQLC